MSEEQTLRRKFSGAEAGAPKPEQPEVPERIRKHAPQPVLRPDGAWTAMADEVDRQVREELDARKAENEWEQRLEEGRRRARKRGY
jgi:hypothetical protein